MRSTMRRLRKQRRARKLTAITAVASLIVGVFAVGAATQMAAADVWAPAVTLENVDPADAGKDFVLAGEDVEFDVTITNDGGGAQFNLSLVALVPASVQYAGSDFGAPTVYGEGEVLPNRSRTAADASCSSLGLVDAPGRAPLCAVPAGQQVWVWSNIDDLPQGGTVSSTITVSPVDDDYPVGSELSFSLTAYTSSDPARLPTYDGSPSVSRTTAHTSGAGVDEDDVPIKALRIVKTEPSSEGELLRGAHENVTTYTLTVENTSRGASDAVTVTDYLPAGLEYLGLSDSDNTTTGDEWTGSGPLAGGTTTGEIVETVQLTDSQAAALGLQGAGVYTKVTWSLGDLAAAETVVITYDAAVPLFANALWSDGTAPSPESGAQAANLDNNTGASTRHGDPDTATTGQVFRNAAAVAGTYQGAVLGGDDALRAATDDDDETVEAVDVKVVKGVDVGGLFATGDVATYSVRVSVSEYVDASGIVLTDVIPNGLCPAFPVNADGVALLIGDLEVSQDAWNAQVPGDACSFPSTASGAVLSDSLHLASISYAPGDGTFTVRFEVDDIAANEEILAQYSVMQRPNYTGAGGGTSSGDRFLNTVTVTAQTDPIDAIANDPELSDRVGGTYLVADDSQAWITSDSGGLTKEVLERGSTPATAAPGDWVDEASQPFSPGDDVWYRITVPFAEGIDTRNPQLTDYLPEGVELAEIQYGWSGFDGYPDTVGPVAYGGADFPTEFVPNPAITATPVTWELGAKNRDSSADRFMPQNTSLTIYLRGVVQSQSASRDDVDSPLNQAKYQQVNVEGRLVFLRADAGIDLDWGATLTKGIRTLNGDEIGTAFGSRAPRADVVQRDQVEYRIDVRAPQNTTADYVVWDVLPAGVTAADVATFTAHLYDGIDETALAAGEWTAEAYDPGDALPGGIDLSPAYSGRSVIVWNVDASVAGSVAGSATTAEIVRGLSLGYTLTVPSGVVDGGEAAQLTQRYVNTAGIVSYAVENSATQATTIVPQSDSGAQQLTTRIPKDGEVSASDVDTVDTAEVQLPDVEVVKSLVSTEVGPAGGAPFGQHDLLDGARNSAAQIVQGEYATFEYSVEIPARTTVKGAVLSDRGSLALSTGGRVDYEYVDGSAVYLAGASGTPIVTGSGATDFRVADEANGAHGVLTFPDVYTNTTDAPQLFRVQITVWVTDRDAAEANRDRTDIRNGTQLRNTATLSFTDPNSATGGRVTHDATARVDFVEPQPSLTKTSSSAQVSADGEVTYTLTAGNRSGRPALYDVVIIDCVPAEITPGDLVASAGEATILDESCAVAADGSIERGTGAGRLIEWEVGIVRGDGVQPTLTYIGTVDAGAGGGASFTNHAELTGYTLPIEVGDDTDTSDRRGVYTAVAQRTVSMPEASIDKTVSPGAAAVGDIVTYTLTTSLPASTNFYDVVLSDELPVGVEYLSSGAHTETVDWAGAAAAPTLGSPTLSDRTLNWQIAPADIGAWDEPRSITVTFQARITDAVQVGAPTNTARFSWSRIDGSTSPSDRSEDTSSVPVIILNPEVVIAKSVALRGTAYADSAAGEPSARFHYRVVVTNTGDAPAYGTVVTDTVEPGIRIDTAQDVFDGAEFSDEAALQEGRGGRITWTIETLDARGGDNTREFVYEATFADSGELRDTGLDNDVAVISYSSAEEDGWFYTPGGTRPGGSTVSTVGTTDTATVTPRFPQIVLDKKTAGTAEAFVGERFSWVLSAQNVGAGSAQTVTLTDALPRNWEYDSSATPVIAVDGIPVEVPVDVEIDADARTVTWTVGSATGASLLPGTATGATEGQRTLTVTFTTIPQADAVVDAGAGLAIDHRNTVSGSATDTTGATRNADGDYTGEDATADAHIARADLLLVKEAIGGNADGEWVAGATAEDADYAQPQWRITITNQGDDPAHGEFRVVDTTDLPDGVTTGSFTARYHAAGDAVGVPIALTGSGTSSAPFIVGDRTLTLAPDGSDSIVLLADVAIDAASTGTAENTAGVIGRTFETPTDIDADNTATATRPISSAADLGITKTLNSAEVTAGRPVTWSIEVVNHGPSVSVSRGDEAITVVDTIPEGISDIENPGALDSWSVEASNGWPAQAGDTVTWTFTGTALPVGPAQELTLTGVVDSSWTGGEIVNRASVIPGATDDPIADNNEGESPVTPGDETSLAISKTRVVLDAGAWKDAAQLGRDLSDVVAGDTVSYRVVVANNGPADAREVVVVDQAPESLTFAEVTDESGSWTHSADADGDRFALSGTIPAAAGTNTRSFIVTYDVDDALAPGTTIVNWVTATAENAPDEVRDSDSTASDRVADLSLVKQALDADGVPVAAGEVPPVTAGTETRFRLTVTNEGPSISGAPIDVQDVLPAGLTYVSSTIDVAGSGPVPAQPTVADGGRSISWAALTGTDTLGVSQTIVIEVTAFVAADVRPQRLVNTAEVHGVDDADPSNDRGTATVEIVSLAEMTITKDVSEGPWIAGTDVEYTITVHNAGPSVADASVTDLLPAGLTAVSLRGEGWTCDDDSESCERSAHPLGDSVITVIAHIDSGVPTDSVLTNTATLSWTDSRSTDPRTVSDDAEITVSTDADLALVKTAIDEEGSETSSAVAGENARYRLEVQNLGTSDAVGPITVVDTLPAGTGFLGLVGESAAAWSVESTDAETGTVVFALQPADAGLAAEAVAPAIEFDVVIDAAVTDGQTLVNTATVSSSTPDSRPANDTDDATLTAAREVDLSISKTHDADAVRIGDELPFTVEVRNAGPSEATGVVVTDVVPSGLEVVTLPGDAVGDGWAISAVEPVDAEDAAAGTRVVAAYALPLAPGESAPALTITTRVLVGAYPQVVNVVDATAAEITLEHPDRTPGDNRAEDEVAVPPMAALVVSKTAVGSFQVGGTGQFRIDVRNDGPTADPGPITVTDALPDGLSFDSSSDAGVHVDGRVITWVLPDGLAVGEEVSLTVTVRIGEAAYPSVTNVVTVGSPSEQTVDARLTDEATVRVAAADPLATTGAEMTWGLAVMALLMLISGALFAAARRQRSAGAAE